MTRVLPSPALSLALFVLWLLLVQSVSVGNLVLGGVLALFWPFATRRLRGAAVRVRKPAVVATLLCRVVADMLHANVRVARAILTRPTDDLRSRFVSIPLELRNPTGLAVLSMIVTFTPGTSWAQLSADNGILLLHVLDIDGDDADEVAFIKHRYERPLREIFE